jgi:hypothetical protein
LDRKEGSGKERDKRRLRETRVEEGWRNHARNSRRNFDGSFEF